jgi:hypothetical protein
LQQFLSGGDPRGKDEIDPGGEGAPQGVHALPREMGNIREMASPAGPQGPPEVAPAHLLLYGERGLCKPHILACHFFPALINKD